MKIIFTTVGSKFFAKQFAYITGNDFKISGKVRRHFNELRNIVIIGLYHPENKFYSKIKNCIIILAGSDVLELIKIGNKRRNNILRRLKRNNIRIISASNFIQDEVYKLFGLKTETINWPYLYEFGYPIPMPDLFSVGCYMPTQNKRFYNYNLILDIAKQMKEVRFFLHCRTGIPKNYEKVPNVVYKYKPIKNMMNFIPQMSCGLRITEHEGFPLSLIEYSLCGRYFIHNRSYPKCIVVSNKPSVGEIIDVINNIKCKNSINYEAYNYYKKEHSPHKFIDDLYCIFRSGVNK